jgi:hypothetical protein
MDLFSVQVLPHSSFSSVLSVRFANMVMPASRELMSFECAALGAESSHVGETTIANRAMYRQVHGYGRVEMLLMMVTWGCLQPELLGSKGKTVFVEGSQRLNFSTSFGSHHYVQLMACTGIHTCSTLWLGLKGGTLGQKKLAGNRIS